MTNKTFGADELNVDATYVFSAWVKAPADHDDVHIQFKYRADGQWYYPEGDAKVSYTGGGAWQHLEARIDLSPIARLEVLNPVTRNVGSRAIPAYWDDLQLSVEQAPATAYDLQVAKDAAFNMLVTDEAGLSETSHADTLSQYETTYWWRVRATNAGGTGYWSAARPMTTEEAPPRRYYVKDHLGSVRAVVDATGDVKETRDDDPVRAAHGPRHDDGDAGARGLHRPRAGYADAAALRGGALLPERLRAVDDDRSHPR
jgi:hypothetical protein